MIFVNKIIKYRLWVSIFVYMQKYFFVWYEEISFFRNFLQCYRIFEIFNFLELLIIIVNLFVSMVSIFISLGSSLSLKLYLKFLNLSLFFYMYFDFIYFFKIGEFLLQLVLYVENEEVIIS